MIEWPVIDASALDSPSPARGFQDTRADPVKLRQPRKQAAISELEATVPLLANSVKLLWGTQELQNAFGKWLLLGYGGAPLPYPVAEALLLLHDLHVHEFGLESAPVA